MKTGNNLFKLLYILFISVSGTGCALFHSAQIPTTDTQAAILGINIDSALIEALLSDTMKMPPLPDTAMDYGELSGNLNFIRTWDVTKPITEEEDITDADLQEAKQTTQYFDGLGRPVQTVAKAMSPEGNDMVSMNVYDPFGREVYKFLPYTSPSNDGEFKTTPFAEQFAFLSNYYNPTADANGEHSFYGATQYEAAPLNTILGVYAPGNSWVGNGMGAMARDLVNKEGDTVCIWNISFDNDAVPEYEGLYDAGELHMKVTSDEGGSITITYTNKSGQVILKRVFIGNADISEDVDFLTFIENLVTLNVSSSSFLNTYYVYDDLGHLRYVLQPKATEWLRDNEWTFDEDNWDESTIAKELCFSYEYDGRGRMIIKRVPGAGEVEMVYDARDRLVMTQDANMHDDDKWQYTQYDDLNRPVLAGLWESNDHREDHQAEAANSTSYPDPGSNNEVLTQTHYDNYDFESADFESLFSSDNLNNADYFYEPDNNSFPYPQAVEPGFLQVRGMPTITKTKVLGTEDTYLYSAVFYDDRGRVVQTYSSNHTSGGDIITTQYSFSGQPLRTLTTHSKGGDNVQNYLVATKLEYDDAGRLITTSKKVENSPEAVIAVNTYDELGQLKLKSLGQKVDAANTSYYAYTSDPVDTLHYTYNVRGWLRGINKDYARNENSADNWFGEELCYDFGFTNIQFNGNIAGIRWRSKGDGEQRSYGFSYDFANRLARADFRQYTGGTWNNDAGIDFSVDTIRYDANGNILSMLQKGLKLNSSSLIDRLNYGYFENSNKLSYVMDTANDEDSKLGDFKEHDNDDSQDYDYDDNGNLVQDNNKNISSISYNFLNLPETITVTGKGTITYTYDAAGNKLRKVTVDNIDDTKTTTTDYIGPFVYKNDTLQFIGQEEGRIRPATPGNSDTFYYDYFEKDHLGNVRVVLTDQIKTDVYPAGMETVNRDFEVALFGDEVNNTAVNKPGGFDSDGGNQKVSQVNGLTAAARVGPGVILKVMAGDKFNAKTYAWYQPSGMDNSTDNTLQNIVLDLIGQLTPAVAAAAKGTELSNVTNTNLQPGMENFLGTQSPASSAPKAYLNWVLLDEELFKKVDGGFVPVPQITGATQKQLLQANSGSDITITKNGYLYVYVSNESKGNVYFDDIRVEHIRGPLLEENSYYPFGLTMAGISSKALNFGGSENKNKFNDGSELQNKEFSDGSGLELYSTEFRKYNPQIGRFNGIDALASISVDMSPYTFAVNNPILVNDPLGLDTLVRDKPSDTGEPTYHDPNDNLEEVVVSAAKPLDTEHGQVYATQSPIWDLWEGSRTFPVRYRFGNSSFTLNWEVNSKGYLTGRTVPNSLVFTAPVDRVPLNLKAAFRLKNFIKSRYVIYRGLKNGKLYIGKALESIIKRYGSETNAAKIGARAIEMLQNVPDNATAMGIEQLLIEINGGIESGTLANKNAASVKEIYIAAGRDWLETNIPDWEVLFKFQ